jgi:hypothetical protein
MDYLSRINCIMAYALKRILKCTQRSIFNATKRKRIMTHCKIPQIASQANSTVFASQLSRFLYFTCSWLIPVK